MAPTSKTETGTDQTLDALITSLTSKNQQVQEQKASDSWWRWLLAGIGALITLIGIGVAVYLYSKRSKELAKARTELEQQRVDLAQQKHTAKQTALQKERLALLARVAVKEQDINIAAVKLRKLETEHTERKKQLDGLKSWSDINAK